MSWFDGRKHVVQDMLKLIQFALRFNCCVMRTISWQRQINDPIKQLKIHRTFVSIEIITMDVSRMINVDDPFQSFVEQLNKQLKCVNNENLQSFDLAFGLEK